MNTLDIVYWGDKHIKDALKGLSDKNWSVVGVTTKWTMRDLMAHIISYEWLLVDAFAFVLKLENARPYLDAMNADYEAFNDEQIRTRKTMSVKALLAEYSRAHRKVNKLISAVGPARMRKAGSIPWYGKQYSLEDFVVYANYGHKEAHLTHISTFRKRKRV
jgi:hypothetical protein